MPRICLGLALAAAAALALPAFAAAEAVDAHALVLESAGREARDLELQRNYTYHERVEQRLLDGAGRTKSTEVKVFDVVNLYGRPYRRLIEKNGKPLPAAEAAGEQGKLDREMAKRARESERERRQWAARQAKELDEERAFRNEIAGAYRFTRLADETVSGLPCFVLQADPKPGFQPRTRRGQTLPKIKAKLWIAQLDKRWVKVDAETIDTLSFGWFLLRVAKGTRFTLVSERVGGEVWMPSRVYLRGDARLAGVKRLNLELDIRWSDFHKFSSDSRLVASQPPEQE